MTNETALQQLGLTDKQIKVYLALLQLGGGTVQAIAQAAGIKRPTTYLVLNELTRLNLAVEIPKKGKKTYIAENPDRLQENYNQKRKTLSEILPQLIGMYKLKSEAPQVLLYEGREGIAQVYQMIATEANEAWWLADLGYIHTHFPEVTKLFLQLIRTKKFRQREINFLNPEALAYVRRVHSDRFTARFTKLPIAIDLAIFGNRVAIFSLKQRLYAVVIQDQLIVESLRTFYELAWRAATPLSKL